MTTKHGSTSALCITLPTSIFSARRRREAARRRARLTRPRLSTWSCACVEDTAIAISPCCTALSTSCPAGAIARPIERTDRMTASSGTSGRPRGRPVATAASAAARRATPRLKLRTRLDNFASFDALPALSVRAPYSAQETVVSKILPSPKIDTIVIGRSCPGSTEQKRRQR